MHRIGASMLLTIATGCGAGATPETAEGAQGAEDAAPVLALRVVEPARERAVVLEIENEGARTVAVEGARARVEVRRDGAPVRECSATGIPYERLSEAAVTLRPGEARRFVTSLPCSLEPGEYALLVDVVLGGGEDPHRSGPLEDHLAASAHVRVEAES